MPFDRSHVPCPLALALVLAALLPSGAQAAGYTDEPPFTFQADDGRRDPFTFLVLKDSAAPAPKLEDRPYPTDYEAFIAQAPKARQAFMDGDFAGSAGLCRAAMAMLVPNDPNAETYGVRCVRDELERILTAAERLRVRADAENRLAASGLQVSGVVATARAGHVIVNGEVLGAGGALPLDDDNERATLSAVRRDEAVVRYRGVLIALPLSNR